MLLLFVPTLIGIQVGHIEDAIWIASGVDALGREGLDVVADAVLERYALVEGIEVVVLIVDGVRIREVDSVNTNSLGSCMRKAISTGPALAASYVTYSCWSALMITQGPLDCGCNNACWRRRTNYGRCNVTMAIWERDMRERRERRAVMTMARGGWTGWRGDWEQNPQPNFPLQPDWRPPRLQKA